LLRIDARQSRGWRLPSVQIVDDIERSTRSPPHLSLQRKGAVRAANGGQPLAGRSVMHWLSCADGHRHAFCRWPRCRRASDASE